MCIGLFQQTAVICRFDARADSILFLMFSYHEPLGRLARWPLKAIPKKLIVPILSGPNRGLWWVSGSFIHGCWLGWYEKPCVEFVASLIRPGMVAFDVGANVGYYTLLLARGVGPKGRVIASPIQSILRI